MFYFILFLIIFIIGFIDISKRYEILRNEFAWSLIIVLFFVAAFRYETGMDWKRYQEIFKTLPTFSTISFSKAFNGLDLGYQLLCVIIKSLGGDIQTVFFLMQLLGSVFLWKTLKLFTNQKITSILIYFSLLYFLLDLNLMRQMVAANMFFYSIHFIKEKQIWKYLGMIALAFSFHWSVLLFLPVYFILNIKLSSITLYIIVALFALFFVFQIKTGGLLYELTNNFFGESEISNRVLFYTTNSIYSVNRVISVGFLLNIIIVIVAIYNRFKLEKLSPYFNLFLNLMLLQLFFYLVMYEYIEISGRLRFYTLISYVIILPYLIQLFKFTFNRMMVYILIGIYCLSYSYIYMIPNNQTIAYNPYQNYLIYKIFDIPSTGESRLNLYLYNFNKERENAKKNQK